MRDGSAELSCTCQQKHVEKVGGAGPQKATKTDDASKKEVPNFSCAMSAIVRRLIVHT